MTVLFVWRSPHLFAVVRCLDCDQDVFVRWPRRWSDCDVCGKPTVFLDSLSSGFEPRAGQKAHPGHAGGASASEVRQRASTSTALRALSQGTTASGIAGSGRLGQPRPRRACAKAPAAPFLVQGRDKPARREGMSGANSFDGVPASDAADGVSLGYEEYRGH